MADRPALICKSMQVCRRGCSARAYCEKIRLGVATGEIPIRSAGYIIGLLRGASTLSGCRGMPKIVAALAGWLLSRIYLQKASGNAGANFAACWKARLRRRARSAVSHRTISQIQPRHPLLLFVGTVLLALLCYRECYAAGSHNERERFVRATASEKQDLLRAPGNSRQSSSIPTGRPSETVRDVVIGMADGFTVPFALAARLSAAVANTDFIVTAGLAEVAAGRHRDGAQRVSRRAHRAAGATQFRIIRIISIVSTNQGRLGSSSHGPHQ
jgi:hypothetical protein